MTDEDRWRRNDPPTSGPSTPPDLRFNPLATGIAVFLGISIPIVVLGYTRAAGPSLAIIGAGIIAGLLVGLLVGLWVEHRDGVIWRGPQL